MNDLVHNLFYWNHKGYNILSKTKVISILEFVVLILSIFAGAPMGMIAVAAILSAITFCVGFIVHMLISHPTQAKLNASDNGLVEDLLFLFFFWQDKDTGEFTVSKTKVISFIIAVAFFILSLVAFPFSLVGNVAFALMFAFPAFLIGSGVHKFTDFGKKQIPQAKKPKEIKKEPEKPKVTPEKPRETEVLFADYRRTIYKLEQEYALKEKKVRQLIEKKFEPPQMSYDKFISIVDSSTAIFNNQANSARLTMNSASEETYEITRELDSKVKVLKSIIDKLDDLIDEFVVNMEKSKEDAEIHDLLDEMERLINSVKEYD